MRAPGGATGVYALECAMDELAVEAQLDPVELRLRNYAERDQNDGQAILAARSCASATAQGAEKFGWAQRNPEPRSMRDGSELVGWGMATGIWEAHADEDRGAHRADRRRPAEVSSATADIGTGTYTIMTQIAADMLGLPLENVTFKLGDSSPAAIAGRGRLVDGGLGRGRDRRPRPRRCARSCCGWRRR